ncbi:MAG: NUDIX hydrolase [bacterium]
MKKWKLLKSEDVSPSKWFPVLKQKLELPDGKIVDDFYISPLGNVVIILPVTKEKEFVFVKQFKNGVNEIMIECPGGNVQKGKTLVESALAELEEEVGIKTSSENLKLITKIASNPTKTNHISYCYIAFDLEINSVQKFDSTENIEIVKVTPKKALEMVNSGEIIVGDSVALINKAYFLYPELFK